jgi:hypothetical protein
MWAKSRPAGMNLPDLSDWLLLTLALVVGVSIISSISALAIGIAGWRFFLELSPFLSWVLILPIAAVMLVLALRAGRWAGRISEDPTGRLRMTWTLVFLFITVSVLGPAAWPLYALGVIEDSGSAGLMAIVITGVCIGGGLFWLYRVTPSRQHMSPEA